MTRKSILFIQLCFSMFVFILPEVNSVSDLLTTEIRKLNEYQSQIEKISVLEYGDRCLSEENKVKDSLKTVFEKILTFDFSLFLSLGVELQSLNEEYKQILTTGHKLCNGSKLLSCDESTNLCTCRPNRLSNREYSYIRDLRDPKGGCLYTKDSPCFPSIDDTHKNSGNYCANNSKCVFKNRQGEIANCRFPNVLIAITGRHDGKLGIPDCYCKADFDEVSLEKNAQSPQRSSPNSNQTNSCECSSMNIVLFFLTLFTSIFFFHALF